MRAPALSVVLLISAACGSGEFPDAVDAGMQTGGGDGGDTGGAAPSVLPFAVDDWYGPSGYMGDGENPGAISDAQQCLPSRPSTWIGNCHRYTWKPSGTKWAGVYWQYPDGNWGDLPGLPIPTGAKQISFQAWGEKGDEKVDFMVGMMAVDGFQVTQTQIALTTTPTKYTLSLAGATYAKVVGGFGWVAKDATAPITFGIDDIRWE
jgi:hypothetical protein